MPDPQPATSPELVVYNHVPAGIQVLFDAESDANLADGQPHATSICIMQVPSVDRIRAEVATPAGLRKYLQCRPEPPEVIAASQYYVQPGESRVFPLDRYEGARHIAVVAGFDTLTPEGGFATVPVPIHEEKERSFIFFSHMTYSAAPMKLLINIGQASISVQGVERES